MSFVLKTIGYGLINSPKMGGWCVYVQAVDGSGKNIGKPIFYKPENAVTFATGMMGDIDGRVSGGSIKQDEVEDIIALFEARVAHAGMASDMNEKGTTPAEYMNMMQPAGEG